jgi:hypothetical protein
MSNSSILFSLWFEVTQSTGIAELDRACLTALEGAPFAAGARDGAAIGASAEVTMRWTAR